ncbi:MAG: cupin domain-containing protein [Thermoleophilia bacterium]
MTEENTSRPGLWIGRLDELVEYATDGTVSKTIVDGPEAKIVLFAMSAGQCLSEHTASVPASIHVLEGKASVNLEGKAHEAVPGTYVYMPAELRHAVDATEDLVFLLTLHRAGKS